MLVSGPVHGAVCEELHLAQHLRHVQTLFHRDRVAFLLQGGGADLDGLVDVGEVSEVCEVPAKVVVVLVSRHAIQHRDGDEKY